MTECKAKVWQSSDGSLWTTIRGWQKTLSDIAQKPTDVRHRKLNVEWTSQRNSDGDTIACNPALQQWLHYGIAMAVLQLTMLRRCSSSATTCDAIARSNGDVAACVTTEFFLFIFTWQLQDLPWRPPPLVSTWERVKERERERKKKGGKRFETCFVGWQKYNNANSL